MKSVYRHMGKLASALLLSLLAVTPIYAEEKPLPYVMAAIGDPEEEAIYKQQSFQIYKFISYFTWPQTIYLENNIKSVTICIYGKDKLGKVLDQIAAEALERDKLKINVKRGGDLTDAGSCNIAYVSNSHKGDYEQILSVLSKHSTVTISDIEGFAEKGGVMEFKIKRGALKFVINKGAATKQNIKIAPDLLELALKVSE